MVNFRLAQLHYFCEVCRTGSVTRAAENLNITQPSVSAAIRSLEMDYGIMLFHREKKRLSLTREGEQLFEGAKKLLEQAEALDTQMHNLGMRLPVIRIGVSPMISVFLFLPIFSQFSRLYPEIALEMHEFGSIESKARLQNNELDMAIVIGDDTIKEDFLWLPLMDTTLLFCVSRRHRLAGAPQVRVEALEGERLILMKATSHQTGALVTHRFEEAGIKPNIVLQSNQLTLIRQYIQSYNAGAFLMKDYLAYIKQDAPDIVGVPLSSPIDIPIGLIRNAGSKPSQQDSVFLAFLREAVKNGTLQSEFARMGPTAEEQPFGLQYHEPVSSPRWGL